MTTRASAERRERRADPVGGPRPPGSRGVLWRSSRNPIIARDHIPRANSIFNSAVVPFGDGFAGVFRVDDTRARDEPPRGPQRRRRRVGDRPRAHRLRSPPTSASREIQERFLFAYDPRVTWLEDRYYVTWCNGYHGPTIGVAYTHDFETFHQLDNAFLPFNRNGVLFPRRIGGEYAMLSRPSDNGHTPFGDIYYSESPDLVHWGRHRHVMAPVPLTLAVDEDRRRTDPDRDGRGLARPLPRCPHVLQRLRLLDGRGAARPRRAVEGPRARTRLPPRARRSSTSRSATSRTSSSRARRSSITTPIASRSTTAPPTRSSASRTGTSPRSSTS